MRLAIDAGGTNLRAALFQDEKQVDFFKEKSSKIPLVKFIEEILKKYKQIKSIDISYAGQVRDGCIIDSPNIKVDTPNISEYFRKKHNISLKIENDLTCAVIAEAKKLKSKNIAALYIGTGLGLGVIEDGKVLRGSTNMATEIGHIPYLKTPLKCGCGRDNCLEIFASGSGIKKWIEYYGLECEPTLEGLKQSEKSQEILQNFETALLYAVGTTITLFNPDTLVLGGGIIEANPYLIDLINSRVGEFCLKTSLKNCKIKGSGIYFLLFE